MQESVKNYIIAGLVLVVLFLGWLQISENSSLVGGPVLSPEEAVESALAFINTAMLSAGNNASLSGDISEDNVYVFSLNVDGEEFPAYITQDGKMLLPQVIDIEKETAAIEQQEELSQLELTIGDFKAHQGDVCLEDGKPIVYFFGSDSCGFCQWEHPIMKEVAEKFEGEIIFKDNMGEFTDEAVFQQYNPQGGVPTLVLGCKYSRVGAGSNVGEEAEANNLTALICHLTDNQPSDVCGEVADLVDQINE